MFQPSPSKLWAVAVGSSQIWYGGDYCLCWVLQGGIIKDEECMFCDCFKWLISVFFSISYIFVYYFIEHL